MANCKRCGSKLEYLGLFDEFWDNLVRGKFRCPECGTLHFYPELEKAPAYDLRRLHHT